MSDETPKAKRRKSSKSPTQRTLELMKSRGYVCAIVEKWNAHARIRQDLFGFIDVLCVKEGEVVGVQTTSGSGDVARIKKIMEHENFPVVARAMRIIVHGWRKIKGGGSRLTWQAAETEVPAPAPIIQRTRIRPPSPRDP